MGTTSFFIPQVYCAKKKKQVFLAPDLFPGGQKWWGKARNVLAGGARLAQPQRFPPPVAGSSPKDSPKIPPTAGAKKPKKMAAASSAFIASLWFSPASVV